jgi:hypothetical protein
MKRKRLMPVKLYNMEAYRCSIDEMCIIKSDLDLDIVEISDENWNEIRELKKNKQEKGCAVYYNKVPIAYAFYRLQGSYDDFFKISSAVCVIAHVFVKPEYRGHRIQGALFYEIARRVSSEFGIKYFYCMIHTYNKKSMSGVRKAGFSYLSDYKCIRIFGRTVKKFKI